MCSNAGCSRGAHKGVNTRLPASLAHLCIVFVISVTRSMNAAHISVFLQIVLSLHGWALDQASELLVDLDSTDEESIRSFTREFAAKARLTLKEMGHDDKISALLMNEEEADFL